MTRRDLPILLGLALISTSALAQATNRLDVNLTGVRNDNGVVRCGLYSSPAGFREPGREFRGTVGKISGGRATCVFANLPPGKYAVAAFHAEQNESQIQTGMFGKPKEGYGFSRSPPSSFGPPSFADAAFDYAGGRQAIQVRLTY